MASKKKTRNLDTDVAVPKRKMQPKPALKPEDVWQEFLGPDAPYYSDISPLGAKNVHCGLCGNTGVIDTRLRVLTPLGQPCGVRRFCICPNGRALKAQNDGALVPPETN
jgi:hypothetical protein